MHIVNSQEELNFYMKNLLEQKSKEYQLKYKAIPTKAQITGELIDNINNENKNQQTFYSGCNFIANNGLHEFEPLGSATALHDCVDCIKFDTCNLKKDTDVWYIEKV